MCTIGISRQNIEVFLQRCHYLPYWILIEQHISCVLNGDEEIVVNFRTKTMEF